jgi:hypothetical protein
MLIFHDPPDVYFPIILETPAVKHSFTGFIQIKLSYLNRSTPSVLGDLNLQFKAMPGRLRD